MIARPRRTLAIALVLLGLCVLAAIQLPSTPSTDLLVGSHTETAQATAALNKQFGQDPIAVVVRGDLSQTLSPKPLVALLGMEGRLARLKGVKAVYGPGTFINQTIVQTTRIINRELGGISVQARTARTDAAAAARKSGASTAKATAAGEAAYQKVLGDKSAEYQNLLVRFGSVGAPALSNTTFVNTLVFGAGTAPKQRFHWLFPDATHALVLVRPKPGISGPEMLALGRAIRKVTAGAKISGTSIKVAGLPLLAAALERETRTEILRLAPLAAVAMLALLLLVLRRRRGRLVSLGLALGSLALCLALSWPLGLGLTVATVAALPVILGLGLDFAVQLQARYWIERGRGQRPVAAAVAARDSLLPTLLLAAGAMAAGFLVLVVSPVPLIDRLGAVLALGSACAVVVALTVGPALLVAVDRGPVAPLALPRSTRLTRLSLSPIILVGAAVLAVCGLALSGRVHLQSDLSQLAPKGLAELRSTQAVQKEIGTSGQVSVAVSGKDITSPAALEWLGKFGARAQAVDKRLSPGPNLADLVSGGDPTAALAPADIKSTLGLLPEYFLDAVVAKDHRLAELTFGVPFVSVEEQGRIVQKIDGALGTPPPGVHVSTAGLVAESSQSTRELDGSRPWLLLLAAGVVGLILFGFWRDLRRVTLVLAPALLAAGLSSLVLAATGLTLSPLAAALEPLVLAIGLEFGMLLDMSFRQAQADGHSPTEARAVATRDIGGAVGLSAATVAAGFAVLGASRLPLLAQLGWLVALELALCLVVAVLVVPMVAEWLALPSGPRRSAPRAPARPLRLRKASR